MCIRSSSSRPGCLDVDVASVARNIGTTSRTSESAADALSSPPRDRWLLELPWLGSAMLGRRLDCVKLTTGACHETVAPRTSCILEVDVLQRMADDQIVCRCGHAWHRSERPHKTSLASIELHISSNPLPTDRRPAPTAGPEIDASQSTDCSSISMIASRCLGSAPLGTT